MELFWGTLRYPVLIHLRATVHREEYETLARYYRANTEMLNLNYLENIIVLCD